MKEYVMESPQNSRWWKMALRWRLDNEPEETKVMFLNKTLLQSLDRAALRATVKLTELLKQGVAQDVAEDLVTAQVAPPDGPALMSPQPPEPLPVALENRIREWARNLPDREVTITL